MTDQEYDKTKKDLLDLAESIENAKRPGYTGANVDILHNFKSVASRLGLTPLQVWGVYFLKHIDAIQSFSKDPCIPQAEAIAGRFADAVNYLKLGYALVAEAQEEREFLGSHDLDAPRTTGFVTEALGPEVGLPGGIKQPKTPGELLREKKDEYRRSIPQPPPTPPFDLDPSKLVCSNSTIVNPISWTPPNLVPVNPGVAQ